jgi:hypothetical protein
MEVQGTKNREWEEEVRGFARIDVCEKRSAENLRAES